MIVDVLFGMSVSDRVSLECCLRDIRAQLASFGCRPMQQRFQFITALCPFCAAITVGVDYTHHPGTFQPQRRLSEEEASQSRGHSAQPLSRRPSFIDSLFDVSS
jgi:hypothetical protein